ncbi:MAG: beta-ketoacyl-[acyl-carrier-protein] synthase family protein [Isosphaeraceae bacterium]|nr:beta-ketoacyl-[acyl-carrier-protein] synthase family protein [Isosphaeraceae bacterium]
MTHESAVWITGIGAVTPLGTAFESIAANLLAGRSGVRAVTEFPVQDHPSQIAARVESIPCPPGWDAEGFAQRRPLERLVLSCCAVALGDSGWWDQRERIRVGLVLGLGAEWLVSWEGDALRNGLERAAETEYPLSLDDVARRVLGLTGPALGLSTACASGNHALAVARRWLALGWVDICLAGACDMGVSPMSLACFGNLRALSRRNAEPTTASRPFDRGRDGFVIGEGGAVFVLEPESSARRRGARAYASVCGFGASSDAHHAVIPSPNPGPAVAAVRQALGDAGVALDEVSYINAHATGTPVGDELEANALRIVLGHAVPRVPVSSTKSMTGHLLTAAGAMECIAGIAAIAHQAVPPTINLDDPDPKCALCHVAHEARPHAVDVVVSNSFGFGGSNTSLVLRRVP